MSHQVKNLNPACQIFIGCLHQSVVEADLYSLTSQFGHVVYIRILRHITTKEPLGLAFVTFSEPESAQRARSELNGVLFKGKHINVTLYCKSRITNANIFVNNLPAEFMAKDLEQIFNNFGTIVSAKVSYDPNNVSNKYGYVQFAQMEQAQKALSSKDPIYAATKIQVSEFVPLENRMDPNHNPNLYVRGFSSDFTAEQMFSLFSQFGEVSSHVIMRDVVRGGGNRSFGFVCYKTPPMALAAIQGLHGKAVEGVTWYVTSHLRRELRRKKLEAEYRERQESWKRRDLFIKNLPSSMTETMLKQLCEEYGAIESVKIHMTENITYQGDVKVPVMVSKGSGFVCFVSEESAKKAYISLRNKMIDNKIIYVAMWKPREELLKNFNAKRFKMFNKQMMEFGAFNPMFAQQMRMPRGRAPQVLPQVPQMMPQMMPRIMHRPVEHPQHSHPSHQPAPQVNRSTFDWSAFNSAPPETKRRMMGEQLYPVVLRNTNERIAGKITGMLLEIESGDLIKLIQNPSELSTKIQEAIEVLRRAWAGNQQNLDLLPK